MAVGSSLYNAFFRRNYQMLALVFASGFAFELGFNRGMDKIWDNKNRGRQWKDIRSKYVSAAEPADADDDE